MARVTVVVPAYNPGAYLDETLRSVLDQTFQDWECVVVDDGSSEDLSHVDTVDARIRLVRQPNRGVSVARNLAILGTEGEYVALLDADDVWLPDKLKSQVELMDAQPQMAFCHTAMNLIDAQSRVIGPGWAQAVCSYRELLGNAHVCTSTVLMRRSCLADSGLFDPLLRATQDYDLWLKLARFHEVGFLPEPLALYRVHSGTLSGDPALMIREVTFVLNHHTHLAQQGGDSAGVAKIRRSLRQARVGWGCKAFDLARAQWGSNKRVAVRSIVLSSRLAPLYIFRQLLILPQRAWARFTR